MIRHRRRTDIAIVTLVTLQAASLVASLGACGDDSTGGLDAAGPIGDASADAPTAPPLECNATTVLPQNLESPPFTQYTVRSGDTDADIAIGPEVNHVVLVPDEVTRDELFVFLPGTGASPGSYRWILRAAALAGYRSIGLAYPNQQSVFNLCEGAPAGCSEEVREELQYGVDVSTLVVVEPADSIAHRLVSLLVALHAMDGSVGWSRFHEGGTPLWSSIALSGHSQGSGQSAYVAYKHVAARIVFFSNPGDAYDDGAEQGIAPWVFEPWQSSAEHLYLFYHQDEQAALRNPTIIEQLQLDAYGPIESVDLQPPPYGCTHTLTTAIEATSPKNAHNMIVFDSEIPLNENGLPVFAEAYLYMLTATTSE